MKNQEDSYHVLQILHDCKHHKLDFRLFCFNHEGLFTVFDFPSLVFWKMLFHCEYHYGFSFKPISHALHERVFHLISVELQSFNYFQFQIMVLNLNSFACIDFVLVQGFLVGSSRYGIGANFDFSMGCDRSRFLSIGLINCLFCKIFRLILKILQLLLSFASFLGLFIGADALGEYAYLDRLFA